MNKILYWLPRILSIIVTVFWAFFVFASHGLSMATITESGIWIALLVFTILAWRGQLIGKIGFLVMGVLYVIMTRGKAPYATVFFVAGPIVFVGILYFLADFLKNKPNTIINKMLGEKFSFKKSKKKDETSKDDSKLI